MYRRLSIKVKKYKGMKVISILPSPYTIIPAYSYTNLLQYSSTFRPSPAYLHYVQKTPERTCTERL
jgi:hypothetical protein